MFKITDIKKQIICSTVLYIISHDVSLILFNITYIKFIVIIIFHRWIYNNNASFFWDTCSYYLKVCRIKYCYWVRNSFLWQIVTPINGKYAKVFGEIIFSVNKRNTYISFKLISHTVCL